MAMGTDMLMAGNGASIGQSRFIHTSYLSRYCVDDVMVLRVDLTIFTAPKLSIYRVLPPASSSSPADDADDVRKWMLASYVEDLVFDASTADVHFIVGKSIVLAHRFILALQSPLFKRIFGLGSVRPSKEALTAKLPHTLESVHVNEETGIAEVSVGAGVEAAAVREMVRYLYTDNLSQEALRQHYDQLLALGCRFQVAGLMSTCAGHMYSTICADNVSRILKAADACGAHDLRAKALAYIVKNAQQVVHTERFFEDLHEALQRDVITAIALASTDDEF